MNPEKPQHKHHATRLSGPEQIRGYKRCTKKIQALWGRNMRIEALLYMGLLVEFFVKEAIANFEAIVEGAAASTEVAFNPRDIYSRTDLESQPLGYLINILNAYTADKTLIQDLRHFARTRNECVHKLFGQSFANINRQLKGFDKFFVDLLFRLMQLNIAQMQHQEKYFDHVCCTCFDDVRKAAKL